jgi:small subunit ribosomal protein S20
MADDKKKNSKVKVYSAKKRDKQNEKRRIENKAFRSQVSTAIKILGDGKTGPAKDKLSAVYSLMDKGVKKGIFTKNKADRFKSRITKRVAAKV